MKKFFFFSLFSFALVFTAMASGHIVTITQKNTLCHDSCNGSAAASVTGGVGPYGYQWNDPMNQATDTAKNLCAGTYTVIVTDSNDMSTATAIVIIAQPTSLNVSIFGPHSVCDGDDVTLVALVSGGTPGGVTGYTYAWSGGILPIDEDIIDGTPADTLPDSIVVFPGLVGTVTYFVTVSDTNGCKATDTAFVSTAPAMTSGISSTHVSACGACDGTATVVPSGLPPFTYNWMPGGSTFSTLTDVCPGVYSVSISSSAGCLVTDSITVLGPPLKANYTMVPDSVNPLNYWGFNTSTGTGLSYVWDFGDGDSAFVTSPTHTYVADGTYNVCLSVSISGSCTDTKCTSLTVNGTPGGCAAVFNITHDTMSTSPNAYIIYNFSYGSTLSYSWDFGDATLSDLENPTHEYTSPGTYLICLSVDNGSGCNQTYCDSIVWVDPASRESDPLSFRVINGPSFPISTDVEEGRLLGVNSIDVFPNPFTDITTFEIRDTQLNATYAFELTDVLGKKVESLNGITSKQFKVSREGLENGIYFYRIYANKNLIDTGKLIVK